MEPRQPGVVLVGIVRKNCVREQQATEVESNGDLPCGWNGTYKNKIAGVIVVLFETVQYVPGLSPPEQELQELNNSQ